MAKIEQIIAREIFDTSADPTVETYVVLDDGTVTKSSVPSGVVINTYEAVQLKDGDKNRFSGNGVLNAVDTVNNVIAPKLVGIDASSQQEIDKILINLDGTQNKAKLGANSILSVSQAVCKAAARSAQIALSYYLRQFISVANQEHRIPTPMFNLIEGGKHAENNLNYQEFLVIPASFHTISESLEIGINVYKRLREFLKDSNLSILNSSEGGFSPTYASNADAFKTLKSVIELTKYSFLRDIFMGVDISANSFMSNKKYNIKDKRGQLAQDDLKELYQALINDYSLVYFEDAFAEDDWDGWKEMFTAFSSKALICGDELICTNPYRLQAAINNNVINAVVIKPIQIGTVTEALAVVEMARFKKLKLIVSSRSGETEDDFIADFAVAIGSDYVKFGAPSRERISKYNRLVTVEQELLNHEPI